MVTAASTDSRGQGAFGAVIATAIDRKRSMRPARVIQQRPSPNGTTLRVMTLVGRLGGAINSASDRRKLEPVFGPMSLPGPLSCRPFC